MAKAIMVQGTMSNAGKSFVVAGLLRVMKQDGFKVAPFKSQNMALNSFITTEGLEMGRAQVMQAEAAGIVPTVKMNPILLKPTTDMGSQVIINGKAIGNMTAVDYYKKKKEFIPQIMESYNALANEYDIVVVEGAGSPAEINLRQDDIVNMGMAKMANAPVVLVGDIDRGGVFAQLYGTVELLENDEKERIKGVIINKFRGDKGILDLGLTMLEEKIKKPVLGVVPLIKIDIDDEDSLSSVLEKNQATEIVDVAVIRLPKVSNFTDFNALEYMDGISVRYVKSVNQLDNPDIIIIPGTKNTMADLKWVRENGLEAEIKKRAKKGTLVFGICGGYQMLGESLSDPLGAEGFGYMEGFGLLPIKTVFGTNKATMQVMGTTENIDGDFSFLSNCSFKGYEIHMGTTTVTGKAFAKIDCKNGNRGAVVSDGAYLKNVAGTYVHGIFDGGETAQKLMEGICQRKGIGSLGSEAFNYGSYKEKQYDILADCIRENIDMSRIYEIIGIKREAQ